MNYVKYILTTFILVVVGILYEKYKEHNVDEEESKHYEVVRKYLLNESSLAQSNLPILWIHIDYKINARYWTSFSSRNSNYLNQPYKYLTIKSIVDKCGGSFNICLIDDDTFKNILPDWNINLDIVSEPIKDNLRKLALAKVLHTYGGMLLPSSFACFTDLISIYNAGVQNNCMFVGELLNRDGAGPEDKEDFCPSTKMMGCAKDCPLMKEYINFMELINATDYTDESVFIGEESLWCLERVRENRMTLIPSEMLGSRDVNGKILTLEMLLGNSYIDLDDKAVGIYIPDQDILRRTAYQWFARLSAGQALSSNTMLGKYLTLCMV
jgi:hypothetical protein